MRESRLPANGLDFRLLSEGPEAGPLVLLLHGFPEGAESWTVQLAALGAAGCWAVAPDLRGFGGTEAPVGEDRYRLPELLGDVSGLIHGLGRDRCHLVGHDWGALVGWPFASRHPELVETWTSLSIPHPVPLIEASRNDPDQRERSSYIDLFRMPGKAEAVLSADDYRRLRAMYRTGPHPEAVPQAVIETYVRNFARPGRLTAGLNYYRANLSGPAWSAFPPTPDPITAPTMLVWGTEDPALGRRAVEATAAHVGGPFRLEVVEGAGHWLQFEAPERVSNLLVEFITSK